MEELGLTPAHYRALSILDTGSRITQLEVTDMAIHVSPPGTRGTRIPKPLLKLFKPMGTLMIRRYRRSGGTKISSRMGFPVVLLTTRGAKTGRHREAARTNPAPRNNAQPT